MNNDLINYNKIIFEEDQPDICDYNKVHEILINYGFTLIEKNLHKVYRYVYIK
jgi:hypothetical protein